MNQNNLLDNSIQDSIISSSPKSALKVLIIHVSIIKCWRMVSSLISAKFQ